MHNAPEYEDDIDNTKEFDKERERILGFRPQSEVVYNKLLPYSSEIDNESNVGLSLIKLNLPKSVLAKELRPGVTHWSKQLLKYIRLYGLKFSKEDHVLFVKLYLELITIPDVEGALIELFFSVLHKLLKKRKLLTRSDLTIEWRPLYLLVKRVLYSKMAEAGLEWLPSTIETNMKSVILYCSPYFPLSATKEILDEFKPLLCPYDVTMADGVKYLEWFLPTIAVGEVERQKTWHLWFKEFLTLWESVHSGPTFEANLITIFARLALHNIGYIDWSPYCSMIFTRLLRIFRLPVGKQNNVSIVSVSSSSILDAIARWIIAMMGGPSSGIVLDHIESMFKAIESYYYPSNLGYWTQILLSFLSNLSFKFVYRVHKERYKKETWEGKAPESHRLTDEEITRFVRILKPVTFLALYSKLPSTAASRTIQLLATIRPELILPDLLEKSYIALETLTEPHQLKGCLAALISSLRCVMRQSKWYSEGRAHIIPILFRALPTIDSNDIPKSLMGINFITTCFSFMPIIDCSEATSQVSDMPEDVRNLCLATTELPDFVILFLDRIFTLIESFNQEHSTQAVECGNDVELSLSMQEGVIMGGIGTSVAVILKQSSDEIYKRSLDKIFQFMSTRLLDGATSLGAVLHICAAVAKSNPELASKKFLPYFTQAIIQLFEENPNLKEEEKVDNQLHWYLVVLAGISKFSGRHVLNYKDELLEVLRLTVKVKAKLAYQQAAMVASRLVASLTTFYDTDHGSTNPSDRNENLPVYDWGKCFTPMETEISWHEPSEEEINFAFDILEQFLLPELQLLREFSDGQKDLSKDELLRSLTVIDDITVGASQLMPDARDKIVEIKGRKNISELSTWPVRTLSYMPHYAKALEERGEMALDLWQNIFNTVRGALWKIMETKEDDVKSISAIISIYSECLHFHEVSRAEFDRHWSVFLNGKRAMRDLLRGGKRHQRLLILNRTVLQHQMRTFAIQRLEYREIIHAAMTDLLKLSMSHYSAVRILAQRTFFRGLKMTPYKSEGHFLPSVLEALEKDPVEDYKIIKGAMHLMLGAGGKNTTYLAYFHEWDALSQAWPAIVKAMKSDRPSMVKLYEKISVKIQSTYSTIAIDVKVSDGCVGAARNIITSSGLPKVEMSELNGVDERLHLQCQENLRLYNKVVADLLELYESGALSWIQNNFITICLSFLVRWDVPLSRGVARMLTMGLVDDTILTRACCLSPITSVLKKQERKRQVVYKSAEEIGRTNVNFDSVLPGDRPDNKIMQYDSKDLPTSAEKYDSTVFIEKTHWAYYQWPLQIKTYVLNDENYKVSRTREEMTDNEQEVFDRLSDPTFAKLLLKYFSLEVKKGADKYNIRRVELFKGIFRNFGDSILPAFREEIERLAKDPQESSQRCVAEFIAGLVVGSKHWNFEKVEALWNWLLPLLQRTMDIVSVETMRDWFQASGHITQNRDPRKLHWFLEFLMKDPVNGKGGSFMDAARLNLLLAGIRQQEWRVAELLHRLLSDIEPKLDHQYKLVRDKMGSVLANIFQYDVALNGDHGFFSPRREAFIERVFQRLSPLLKEGNPPISVRSSDTDIKASSSRVPELPLFEMSEDVLMTRSMVDDVDVGSAMEIDIPESMMANLQHGLQKILTAPSGADQDKEMMLKQFLQQEQREFSSSINNPEALQSLITGRRLHNAAAKPEMREDMESTLEDAMLDVDKERNSAIRLLKTLMKFIVSTQRNNLQPTKECIWRLLPLICKMSPVDTQSIDEELHQDTQRSLSCLAQSYTPPQQLLVVIYTVKEISGLSSWHARFTMLKFLQIFIFNNLFTLKERPDCVTILEDVILKLIADEQLEVREMATKTLGGLLQCGFLNITDKLKNYIKSHCKVKVKQKKKAKQDDADKADYQLKLRNRHAGVLAMSACVLSNSYSIPDYLPDLLMELSNHLHDPQPIQGTVKKTFSEFRRTHHDSWHLDKLKFTDDQLSILTDLLVSPCYYA